MSGRTKAELCDFHLDFLGMFGICLLAHSFLQLTLSFSVLAGSICCPKTNVGYATGEYSIQTGLHSPRIIFVNEDASTHGRDVVDSKYGGAKGDCHSFKIPTAFNDCPHSHGQKLTMDLIFFSFEVPIPDTFRRSDSPRCGRD